ncbi:hypothetical protein [Sphingopyxis sp. LC81]|uniref:hypothetical protein n=1 Tax=Sphingopyxis sp. LC81 TaxID=1502850 RepID=UPI00126A2122|nr:hypothetical protein [Sphingopyxis sp. LC81]
MIFSIFLFAAVPAAEAENTPRQFEPSEAVQGFVDKIAPKLEAAKKKLVDSEAVKARRKKLGEQLGRIESASPFDNVSVSLRENGCFGGECAKLSYYKEQDREELVRIADKAFSMVGLYGDDIGFGNYPRPNIPENVKGVNLTGLTWINWSACQELKLQKRVACLSSYEFMFGIPGLPRPDPSFYVNFRTQGNEVSFVEIVFEQKAFFDRF